MAVVALQVDAVLLVPDAVRCDGWVVRDLLADQLRCPDVVFPFPEEEFAQEGVERLLLAAQILTPACVLLLKGCKEPFQD